MIDPDHPDLSVILYFVFAHADRLRDLSVLRNHTCATEVYKVHCSLFL